MKCGHSPRYCDRGRIPDDATFLSRGRKAREENDPRVRRPDLSLVTRLRGEGRAIFFGEGQLGPTGDGAGGSAAMRNTVYFLSLPSLSPPPPLPEGQKGPKPPPLQHEIVVTATRIETPARELASSVTVITRADLEKSNGRRSSKPCGTSWDSRSSRTAGRDHPPPRSPGSELRAPPRPPRRRRGQRPHQSVALI